MVEPGPPESVTSGGQSRSIAALDSLLDRAATMDLFSGNVAIAEHGRVTYARSLGLADRTARISNERTTRFAIGSITKLFTRVLVLQLVRDGRLSWDATVGSVLDGFFAEVADHVTVRQLFDHTSGLGQYFDLPGFREDTTAVARASDLLPWLRRQPLEFSPGAQAMYSNSGYALLAAILEKVEAKAYDQILSERILTPLGMQATGVTYRQTRTKGKAIGYLSNMPGEPRDNLDLNIVGAGDGGIYSTVDDLLKLDRSLALDHRLLSDPEKLLLVNEPLFPRQFASWDEFRHDGRIGLAGGAPGISAVYGHDMASDRTVIVLSNYDEGSAEEIFRRIGALLRGQAVAPLTLPPARFLYSLLLERGAPYFTENVDRELDEHGLRLEDDMPLWFAGQALIAEKKHDLAMALYRYYTTRYPNIVVAWNDLGDLYVEQGDKSEARRCYEKALTLRPGNPRAQAALARL